MTECLYREFFADFSISEYESDKKKKMYLIKLGGKNYPVMKEGQDRRALNK